MTLTIADARLDVYKPGNTSTSVDDADHTVPGEDIADLRVSARAQDLIDQGKIRLQNHSYQYSGVVTSGDRLEFRVLRDDGGAYGVYYGEDYGGSARRWTGLARSLEYDNQSAREQQLVLSVDDWVFGLLDNRTVINGFENAPIAGSSDAILNRILQDDAPEIDRSQIESVPQTTSVVWNGASLLDAVKELADRSNALVWGNGLQLGFGRLDDQPTKWQLQPSDKGLHSVTENDDNLANHIRVAGGDGLQVDTEQTTQDGYTTVTQSSRLTHQISMRKAEVARLELWTRKTGSGENFVVRLQKDDGGAPIDPSSEESDIENKTLAPQFVTDDGFTTFIIPEHTLPEPNPWLVVESEDSSGQEIGINTSTGEPAFRAYYPYPLETVLEVESSIDEYGRRERFVRRDSLETRAQTIDFARAMSERTREPARELKFPAESKRAHNLTPGDVIGADLPNENLVDDVVVTEVSDRYSADTNRLATEITAQQVSTL